MIDEEACAPGSRQLVVEVQNRGALSAEPMSFHVRFVPRRKGAQVWESRIERCVLPYVHRFGRPAPAGGKERYRLQIAATADEGRCEVRVERATWFEGAAVAKPKIELGGLEQIQQSNLQGQAVGATRVRLTNPLARDVDLVFLATYRQPRDATALLGVRVRARSEREWTIADWPGALGFGDSTPSVPVRVDQLELIDWCLVGEGDAAAARELFRSAYRGWLRWPEPAPAMSARFEFTQRTPGAAVTASGKMRIDAAGAIGIELAEFRGAKSEAEAERLVSSRIQRAFADLRRSSLDDALASNQFRLVDEGLVELDGKGWWTERSSMWQGSRSGADDANVPVFRVRDGRIVGSGVRRDLEGYAWEVQDLGPGWVVKQRRTRTSVNSWSEHFDYALLDGLAVPTAYRDRLDMPGGGLMSQDLVKLSEIAFDRTGEPVQLELPRGDGAAALQRAWESGYRYAREPRELAAKFEVQSPGTDLTWQRVQHVSGSVRLEGFRGFRMQGPGWRSCRADIEGELAPELEDTLALALEDRLRLWSFRDFNGRSEFAEVFAGASIEAPTAEGSFRVSGSPYRELSVAEGRIVATTQQNGLARRFTWSKVDDQMVVTRVQSGDEDLRAKFAKVGDALVPTSLDFRGVFGKEWGPESLQLSGVRLR